MLNRPYGLDMDACQFGKAFLCQPGIETRLTNIASQHA